MTTNNTVHPIEFLIVCLIALFEGCCWVLNELAGFHAAAAQAPPPAPAPAPAPAPVAIAVTPAPAPAPAPLAGLTVKQLRRMAVDMGLPRAQYHRARKADLIACLA